MPGYANFLPDTLLCMRACTGVVFTLAPSAGELRVEAERCWNRAEELGIPVVAYVNRMDRENADFQAALDDFKAMFGVTPVPLQIPIGAAADFRGVIDLLSQKALITTDDGKLKTDAVPTEMSDEVEAAREQLIESAAEATDELTEKYLDEGTLSDEDVRQALREGTVNRSFVPVLCGSATMPSAIHPLLDAIADYLSGAEELGESVGRNPSSAEEIRRQPKTDEPFSAYVYKTIVDPFAGKLTCLRILSGTAKSDLNVLNATKDSKERLGHLLKLDGKKQVQVDRALPGEVIALAKLKDTSTGDTLCDEKSPVIYPGIELPPPAISFAVAPEGKGDEEKAAQALSKLCEEDPSLEMHRDPQTRELILSGVGQLHIEVVIERMKRKYGAEVVLKAPKIPYKETIRGKSQAQGKLKKQSGGRGQFGDTWIEIQPATRGTGFEFVNKIVGGAIPRQYIPAVEKGVKESMADGFLAGYPIVDIKVTLYDGSFHEVDSSEMAFKIAASMGFKAAMEKAKPVLLEPIVNMEVTTPDECMGDVIGDLNSRRGKVQEVNAKPNGQVIQVQVPLSETLKYAPDLRSMTSGRASFTIGFSHYEELPAHMAEKVINESKSAKQEES